MNVSEEIAMSKEPGAADSAAEEPNNSPPSPKYTDGGYGWVIVASCFVISGLAVSFLKSFGIFFLDIQEHFDTLAFKVSWISAINVAVFHLGSPLASALSLLLSHRVIVITGGILSMLGMLLGSFGFSLLWMYLTTGFLVGLLVDMTGDYSNAFYVAGGGMFVAACFLVLADYFLSCEQNSSKGTEKEMQKFTSRRQPPEEAEKEKLGTDRTHGTELEPMNTVSE